MTTPEGLEAFCLIKSPLMGTVEPERVAIHDTVNFCNILVDDKITMPLFRLHFNKRPWKVGLLDGETKDERGKSKSWMIFCNWPGASAPRRKIRCSPKGQGG